MAEQFSQSYTERFSGVGRLFGRAGMERLRAAHVCVVGAGGVGSWAVEGLARSGVGALTLIDLDDVCVTNVNRQLPAIDGEIGRPKVDVLARRARLINPEIRVEAVAEFFTAATAERLLGAVGPSEKRASVVAQTASLLNSSNAIRHPSRLEADQAHGLAARATQSRLAACATTLARHSSAQPDSPMPDSPQPDSPPRFECVIDAIDSMSNKALLIAECARRGLRCVTVGGAGGRRDASAIRTGDLGESMSDELLRQVRKKLRRDHGFARGEGHRYGVRCVYSIEKPVYPWADGTCAAEPEPTEAGGNLKLDCESGFGTAVFVTGAFGLAAAGEAARWIALSTPTA